MHIFGGEHVGHQSLPFVKPSQFLQQGLSWPVIVNYYYDNAACADNAVTIAPFSPGHVSLSALDGVDADNADSAD
ncbi:MAG TPA: hypothetical protein VI522_01670 [Gammaproteobacteria bacterium]|nr:hypothetical protein [Gammaproteobacteria bacterium]